MPGPHGEAKRAGHLRNASQVEVSGFPDPAGGPESGRECEQDAKELGATPSVAQMSAPSGIRQPGVHTQQVSGRTICCGLTRDSSGLNAACTPWAPSESTFGYTWRGLTSRGGDHPGEVRFGPLPVECVVGAGGAASVYVVGRSLDRPMGMRAGALNHSGLFRRSRARAAGGRAGGLGSGPVRAFCLTRPSGLRKRRCVRRHGELGVCPALTNPRDRRRAA